ncbi:MAG: AAA family ATPase [Lachnospiraceae bacterium]|jgi:DNA repair exonuclease SbcCD ATPase subunit|nr:AAA family ATPase [Lachnospiraceae bacterium]
MNKTVLRNIRLVNWYGFSNRTIPVAENLTLISGENECGKSTILDAVKYAYTGDTQFNKATSGYNTGVGKRNLVSYTRCLVDASAGIYARPADKIPVVYTHIALEYFDQINEHPFVLGVVIETAVTDIRGTYWYAMDGKTLADISFVYEENSVLKPYDASGFQKKHGVQMKNKKEGITLFMQMTGLKLPYQEVPKYQRKLRNIMAYNPAAKIQEFIKESVLEEHDVNFDKLKEAKKNIEQINNSLEQINQELQDLDSILADYDEHDKKAFRLKIDDIKAKYKKLVEYQGAIREAEEIIQKNTITCAALAKTIREQEQEIDEIDNYYSEAKRALHDLDVSKAIRASKELLHTYEEQLAVLRVEMDRLESFQRRMQEMISLLKAAGAKVQDDAMAGRLISKEVEIAEKQRFLDLLKEEIRKCRDRLVAENALLERELSGIQEECTRQNEIIENCNKNRADYSYVREQTELIKEINREFKKRGISEEAHMACEYVVELKDEAWRDAIEAFLGMHRYAILVSRDAFDVANAVLDQSQHRYVELVNTKRLMARDMECEEDSVFHYLHIQNETAANYFKFWLGRIHAVEIGRVPDFDNAMSKEGKLSRNMAVTYINTRKIKSYCLGSEAVELNKRAAQKRLRELENREKEIFLEQKGLRDQSNRLQAGLDCFKEYNLNAHREAAKTAESLNEERGHYQELLEAQKNNAEFMALNERVTELGKQLDSQKKLRTECVTEKTILETTVSEKQKSIRELQFKAETKQAELEEERACSHLAVEKAMEEYDGFLSGAYPNGGLMQYETKTRTDRRVRELEANINGKQQAYNNRKQEVDKLPMGLDCEAAYQKRRGKIWIDDLQGIQQKLKEQTITYERIFKREFVLNIYETAKDARSDISDINKELRKLQFSTKYQFDVKMLSDSSDYAKILRYAEYLQETNNMSDGQMTLTGWMGYEQDEVETREKEIRDIINKIIDHNDIAEIRKFADYRNYMSYEIIINNAEVKDGKLSKQVGYNSGAGTQIPYTLILSAALSMLYNVRVNSVRLIFIDEPFEKMSDHNIKLMLEFFKNQNFQVIFCAPPNKLESIGSECGVIIPVLKISNDNMQIGKVRFYEQ